MHWLLLEMSRILLIDLLHLNTNQLRSHNLLKTFKLFVEHVHVRRFSYSSTKIECRMHNTAHLRLKCYHCRIYSRPCEARKMCTREKHLLSVEQLIGRERLQPLSEMSLLSSDATLQRDKTSDLTLRNSQALDATNCSL